MITAIKRFWGFDGFITLYIPLVGILVTAIAVLTALEAESIAESLVMGIGLGLIGLTLVSLPIIRWKVKER